MAIKIYCVTKERLTRLNHSGYFIFIDSFSTEQEDCDLHLFLFAHPGQLPDRFLFFCYGSKMTNLNRLCAQVKHFLPGSPPHAEHKTGLRTGKGICLLDSFPASFDPTVEDGL